MPHILVVEDETAITDTLPYVLQVENFATTWVTLAGEALALWERQPADLLILDVGLPDAGGFEACKRLRRSPEVPIIFLAAHDTRVDRVAGPEIGVDDYMVKPLSPREVATRIKAILKRMAPRPAAPEGATPSGPFQVGRECVWTHYRDAPLDLTRYESRPLQMLLGQPERVFSYERLLDAFSVISEAGYEHNVDNHIRSLCTKLRQVNERGEAIQTHRGLDYNYSPDHA